MWNRIGRLLLLLMLVLGTATATRIALRARPATTSPPQVRVQAQPTLEQIRTLSQLTTLRVVAADVCVVDVQGKAGGIRAVLVVRGEAVLGTDLEQAALRILDPDAHRAVITLSAPRVLSARVDHQRTHVATMQTRGLWTIVPDGASVDAAVLAQGFREAESMVSRAATSEDLRRKAREQTESVIGGFGRSLGWSVICEWRPP